VRREIYSIRREPQDLGTPKARYEREVSEIGSGALYDSIVRFVGLRWQDS
jgi:hypothetical protein